MFENATTQANQNFKRALALQEQGDYAQAAIIFEHLLAENPSETVICSFLGLAYLESDRGQLALDILDQAISQAPKESNLHMQRAFICKRLHKPEQAIYHYQQVLRLNPNHAKAHNNLAMEYAATHQYSFALQHYRDAVHSDPSLVPAHFNLGLLFLKQGEWQAAEMQFNNVIALDSEYATAYFYLGTLYLEMNRLEESETAFRTLLGHMPEHVEGWVNRGVVALKQKNQQMALDYFTQALVLDNNHREARNNMAATLIHFDRYEAALHCYQELLKDEPNNLEYLYNSGVAEMGLGQLAIARQLFQQVLSSDKAHFGALSNLAAIHLRTGDREAASALLARALEIHPHDPATQFMFQALRGERKTQHACPEYVQDLFNHYALYYDAHMERVLEYAVPKRLWELFHQASIQSFVRALDLGCGTGLTGMILRPLSQHLTGVDLAAKMLAIAREKNIYDALIEAELLGFMRQTSECYDCIVAADVLPYLSDLSPLFEALSLRLSPGGVFWFTTEISVDDPWALQATMRFCHHPDYIVNLCQQYGFKLSHQETLVARKQDAQDLKVNLFGINLKKLSTSECKQPN